MYDVTATGELLIDFTRNGLSKQNNRVYEANPGGAPCNVLAMLGKLGYKTAFIGKVGNDHYGDFFRKNLQNNKDRCHQHDSGRTPFAHNASPRTRFI